ELQHAVERALIMGEETTLRPEDFLLSGGKVGTEESLAFDEYNLEEVEKQVIELALRKHQGNVSHAARELGLTRTSLYRRMEKYGL
ncbi:MAG: sigma-54-dependent Fis family transcriptional regulator, partial [Gemmatimonadetes bacterium]|nr:sigma-54-dependent Fis family transcriptional regulator [Gemmatimonadota bacterium]